MIGQSELPGEQRWYVAVYQRSTRRLVLSRSMLCQRGTAQIVAEIHQGEYRCEEYDVRLMDSQPPVEQPVDRRAAH